MDRSGTQIASAGVSVLLLSILYIAVIALLIQFAWNILLSKLFNTREIGYLESVAIVIILAVLKGLFFGK